MPSENYAGRDFAVRGFAHFKLLFISLLILFLLAAAIWRAWRVMHSMTVVASSSTELQQAKPDTKIKVVVEVSEVDATGLTRGVLLEKKTEELYSRTPTPVTTQASSKTKIVMGKKEDVRKGAIIHVTGTRGGNGTIEAEQIVILTGYVKVN